MRGHQWIPGILVNIASEYIKPYLPWLGGGCVTATGWLTLSSSATLHDYVTYGIYGVLVILLWMDLRSRRPTYKSGPLFEAIGQYHASDARNDRTYLQPRVVLTLLKNVKNAHVQLRIYQLGYGYSLMDKQTLNESMTALKDTQLTYTIAVIPIEPGENAHWGPPDTPFGTLAEGGRYIASVRLRTRWSFQEHRIYIEVSSPRGHNYGKAFFIDERHAIIDWLRIPTLDTPNS